ncbi:MAG: type II toxin-antitoxin system Phd/YefM family antitoxin [Nitrospirales bacterium]
MKTISVRDLQKRVRESVDAAQADRVVITRSGKPAAVLVGVEGQDWETVVLETNAKFWRLTKKRRKQRTVSMSAMRKRLRTK